MNRRLIFLLFLFVPHLTAGQAKALQRLMADSSMDHSTVSLCIFKIENGETVYEHNAGESNIPASDGSGMSPMDAVTSRNLTDLLLFMKTKGKYFIEFYNSLPDAGKEGTL